jgi:hypothetical protein
MTRKMFLAHARSTQTCLASFALLAALTVAACKKDEEVEYPPTPPQNFAPPADAGAPPPAATTDAAPAPAADAGPPPVDLITQQILAESIQERAKKEARGMKPEGELVSGMVQASGHIEQAFMINPQKCYGVIAEGGPGVTEVDVQIMAKPMPTVPLPGPLIAVDQMQGAKAAITPCWKNIFPVALPATAIAKATQGAGALALRVYVK